MGDEFELAMEGDTKKKRRSRGKKKKNSTNENTPPATSVKPLPSKEECGNTFSQALESIHGRGGDLDEWADSVNLSNCRIDDKRAKRIAQSLTESATVTMLDFSHNAITDQGAQALCQALVEGGAPHLIMLNLQSNNLTDTAQEALITELAVRPKLVVHLSTAPVLQTPNEEPVLELEECMPEPPKVDAPVCYAPPSPIKCGEDSSQYVSESLQTIKDEAVRDPSDVCEALETLLQVLGTDMESNSFESFRCVGANMKIFSCLLSQPSTPHEHTTGQSPNGLGVRRYLVSSIVSLCTKLELMHPTLHEHGVCLACLNLFFEFPFASGLHYAVTQMLLAVLDTPGELRDTMILNPGSGLLSLMAAVVGDPLESHSTIGLRSGVVGPLVIIFKAIKARALQDDTLGEQLVAVASWEPMCEVLETLAEEQEGGLGPTPEKPGSAFGDMSNTDMNSFLQSLPAGAQQQLLSQMMGFRSQ